MIDIELRCGWRVVGTTERARGVQVHDADGNVVQGVAKVVIEVGVNDLPRVTAELLPRLSSESMDPPPDSLYTAIAEGRVGSARDRDSLDAEAEIRDEFPPHPPKNPED